MTTSVNSFLYVEVVNYFKGLLEESIEACASSKMGVISYKTIVLDEYYGGGFDETTDEDGNNVQGIDVISNFIVLNDDTRSELNRAFEEARDEVFEDFINECFLYIGQPGVAYIYEEDAIEDAKYDFINDKANLNEDVSIYFDEENNPTDLYKTEISEYLKERVFSVEDAEEKGIEFEIEDVRHSSIN